MEYLSKATNDRTTVKLIRAPISVTPVTSAACKIGGRTSSRVRSLNRRPDLMRRALRSTRRRALLWLLLCTIVGDFRCGGIVVHRER